MLKFLSKLFGGGKSESKESEIVQDDSGRKAKDRLARDKNERELFKKQVN